METLEQPSKYRFVKGCFKSLHQPTIINVSIDKHNASPPSSMVDLPNTLINLTQQINEVE